ncbi:MAG: hypothetical protein IPM96_11585 [Ignavibacteria bacterium]|nr:hypothetical protein [Ignavibacteria bacterium]
MKSLFISLLCLITINFWFQTPLKVFGAGESVSVHECQDYWYDIIYKDGSWWIYHYCGTELVYIDPYVWD